MSALPESGPGRFRPRGLLASPHLQSVLTSGPWRRRSVGRRTEDYRAASRREIVSTPEGVHLLGYRNLTRAARRRGLVILLHGWEGSVDSNYLLSTAATLDRAGFDTFRLNFRDHGDSHHLNLELFHSCRLREVLDAVRLVAQARESGPVYLVGFSLGGNFALRVARHGPANGLELDRVVAISPVVRPRHVMEALENGFMLYEQYFVVKWRRSLQRKQLLFPEHFDFSRWFRLKKLRSQTAHLVEHYTDFPNLEAYLEGYSIAGDYLEGLKTPSLVITAADDPIIPIRDFQALPRPDALTIEMLGRGGHCGFLENWRLECWIERKIVSELCQPMNN